MNDLPFSDPIFYESVYFIKFNHKLLKIMETTLEKKGIIDEVLKYQKLGDNNTQFFIK